ncbi:hypothetical protein [Mitsuokella sp. AF21-1AC]|uniref:hypothetical protein n=1 Tax=Mitsuokella sp. AF21-1AC TaxID=2292235 RepID=UPI000E4A4642|nr:hypothetical protein [Mitsuokella sp. AF21-1AC]RGS74166.1 hypothetical protein DWX75_02430 [Mitsuokella sp. AF21-1AC]
MDDYTWKKTIRRRRIHRNRQVFGLVVLLIIAAIAGTAWYFYNQRHSPSYALKEIQASIEKHDADTFRHYVNLDLLTSRAYDDLTADLFSYDATLTAATKASYEKFYIMVKPQLTSGTEDTILRRVADGSWTMPEGTDILKGRQLGIDYERFLERTQMRHTSFVQFGKVERDGTTATAEMTVRDEDTQTEFTLELAMEQAADGHWQVTYIKNYRAYLDAVTPLHNNDIAQYIDSTKDIVAAYNEKFEAYKQRFTALASAGPGNFTPAQKQSLTALLQQEVIPALQERQQKLDAIDVPSGARYLASQRQQATAITIEAWQHFLQGISDDNPDEFAKAESLHKKALATDLRVDDIIRHTAVSRNIPNLP